MVKCSPPQASDIVALVMNPGDNHFPDCKWINDENKGTIGVICHPDLSEKHYKLPDLSGGTSYAITLSLAKGNTKTASYLASRVLGGTNVMPKWSIVTAMTPTSQCLASSPPSFTARHLLPRRPRRPAITLGYTLQARSSTLCDRPSSACRL